MFGVIDDELLARFVVEGTWDGLPGAIIEHCCARGCDVNVVLCSAGMAARKHGGHLRALRRSRR
ncbi:MAG: hypothetical protein M5U19_17880 [Microthrixaceae bacterium]|nr:hypothetical protein [Microthrixaceae bacterium]